jgi:hypothetical protein
MQERVRIRERRDDPRVGVGDRVLKLRFGQRTEEHQKHKKDGPRRKARRPREIMIRRGSTFMVHLT